MHFYISCMLVRIYTRTLQIFWPICVELCRKLLYNVADKLSFSLEIGALNVMPYLMVLNNFLHAIHKFWSISKKSTVFTSTAINLLMVCFVKIREMKAVLYWKTQINFSPYPAHILSAHKAAQHLWILWSWVQIKQHFRHDIFDYRRLWYIACSGSGTT